LQKVSQANTPAPASGNQSSESRSIQQFPAKTRLLILRGYKPILYILGIIKIHELGIPKRIADSCYGINETNNGALRKTRQTLKDVVLIVKSHLPVWKTIGFDSSPLKTNQVSGECLI